MMKSLESLFLVLVMILDLTRTQVLPEDLEAKVVVVGVGDVAEEVVVVEVVEGAGAMQ